MNTPTPTHVDGTGPSTLNAALEAARQAGTAHIEVTASNGVGQIMTSQGDFTPGGGRQVVNFGFGNLECVVSDGKGYLRGDYQALVHLLGISPADATQYADKWIEGPDNGAFGLSGDVVINDLLQLDNPSTNVGAGSAGNVISITGQTPDGAQSVGSQPGLQATLDVSEASPHYPDSLTVIGQNGTRITYTFSRWGEPVQLSVPAGAIAVGN